MAIGDAALSKGDLMRRLHRLERHVQELQAGRRLAAATVGEGGIRITDGGNLDIEGGALRVFDASGNLVATVGRFPDSTERGIAAVDPVTGALVALSTLAFGMRVEQHGQVLQVTSTSGDFSDPDTGDPGPTITDVPIGTAGRCVVFVSADLRPEPSSAGDTTVVEMGVEVSGATTRTAGSAVISLGQGTADGSSAVSPSGRVAGITLIEGLNAGMHTFQGKYRTQLNTATATITVPVMIVMPF